MREIGFTSKVFSPELDRRAALGRRAAGRRARPRHLQQGRPDRHGRADHRALADRNRKGVPLRARGARRRALGAVHRPQHPPRLRHRGALRRDGPRHGRASGDQGGGRLGRAPDRLYGAARPSAGNRDSRRRLATGRRRPHERLARADRSARPAGRAPARKRAQALRRPQSRGARHASPCSS